MNWDKEKENIVKNISNVSKGYLWMTRYDTRSYLQIHNWGTNIVILGTEIAAVLSSIGLFVNLDGFIITSQILSFMIGLLAGVMKYNQYETKISELKRLSAKFASLINNIQRQLTTSTDKRENYEHYIVWITKNFQELIEMIPDYLSSKAQDKYEILAREKGLPVPNDVENDSKESVKENKESDEKKENVKESDEKITIIPDNIIVAPNDRQKTIKKLKEQNQGTLFHDLSMYEDENMKYELQRFQRHND